MTRLETLMTVGSPALLDHEGKPDPLGMLGRRLRYVMIQLANLVWLLCGLAACTSGTPATAERPKLVAQRVTATVKRDAARLVHIRTEHEALLATPEHPFATPQGGWIPAGRLVSGDQLVSARFGTSRVLSAQRVQRAQPGTVFNLSVAPSHTYLVGTGQVLVHNTKCMDPAERDKEIGAAERKLADLKLGYLLASAENKPILQQQIAQLKGQITKLKHARVIARARQKRKGKAGAGLEPSRAEPALAPDPRTLGTNGIGRDTRAIEVLDREIREIAGTSAGSSQRLKELSRERTRIKRNLNRKLRKHEGKQAIAPKPSRERLLAAAETDYESRKKAVDVAQRELSALLGEEPQSDAEKRSHAERRGALERKLKSLQLEQVASREILNGERRLAELAGRSPSTDAEQQQIAAEQRALAILLSKQRKARRTRDAYRRKRADPDAYEELLRKHRDWERKRFRIADSIPDTKRPRDLPEIWEHELDARRQEPGSDEERAAYITEHAATLKALIELRRQRKRIWYALGKMRARRGQRIDAGQDTKSIAQRLTELEQERDATAIRHVQLRLREKVLSVLERMARRDGPDTLDETRLREVESELEGELASGGSLGEQRLREIQHDLGEFELIDAEFLDSIWREAEAVEAASQELQETVQDEAEGVDALLKALGESWEKRLSPERSAATETDWRALQRELGEERRAVEAADFALANEQAFLDQNPGGPSSIHAAAGAPRLLELQQQRLQLRSDWRQRMQRRLEMARQELRTIQGVQRFRDEMTEAALARTIAVLENELQNPPF